MASAGNEEGEFGLQIAPMLDVMFVLLLFFMVSAGQVVKDAELGVVIPSQGSSTQTASNPPITLAITDDGSVSFNGAPEGTPDDHFLSDLRDKLDAAVQFSSDQAVIIAPGREVAFDRVVNVLDACAHAKVRVLSFRLPSKH